MYTAAAVVYGFTIGLCLLLAIGVSRKGPGWLVAGYEEGTLDPDREQELTDDVRTVLLGVAGLTAVSLIEEVTDTQLRASELLLVGVVLLVGWLLWKYNVKYRDEDSS